MALWMGIHYLANRLYRLDMGYGLLCLELSVLLAVG